MAGEFDDIFGVDTSGNGAGQFDDIFGIEPEGGFIKSAKKTIGQTIKGAGQVAADFIPGVSQDNAVKKYGQEVVDANPTAVNSFEDIAKSPLKTVKEAVGNAAAPMAGMLGVRAIGQGITAAAPLTGPAAPIVAGIGQAVSWLGPAAIAALPSFSGIRDKQILNDPVNQESAKAKAIAALGASTVGFIEQKFGPQNWAMGMMTKEGREALAKKFASSSLLGSVGTGITKGAAVEGAEELVQNPVEQLASFDNPLTKENMIDTAFGGAMGAIGGGVIGGSFGGVNYATNGKQEVPQDKQPDPQQIGAGFTPPANPPKFTGPISKALGTAPIATPPTDPIIQDKERAFAPKGPNPNLPFAMDEPIRRPANSNILAQFGPDVVQVLSEAKKAGNLLSINQALAQIESQKVPANVNPQTGEVSNDQIQPEIQRQDSQAAIQNPPIGSGLENTMRQDPAPVDAGADGQPRSTIKTDEVAQNEQVQRPQAEEKSVVADVQAEGLAANSDLGDKNEVVARLFKTKSAARIFLKQAGLNRADYEIEKTNKGFRATPVGFFDEQATGVLSEGLSEKTLGDSASVKDPSASDGVSQDKGVSNGTVQQTGNQVAVQNSDAERSRKTSAQNSIQGASTKGNTKTPVGEGSQSTRNLEIVDIKAKHGRHIGNWIAKQRNEGNPDVSIYDARQALGIEVEPQQQPTKTVVPQKTENVSNNTPQASVNQPVAGSPSGVTSSESSNTNNKQSQPSNPTPIANPIANENESATVSNEPQAVNSSKEQKKTVHDYSNTQVAVKGRAARKLRALGRSIPDSELYVDPKDDSYGRETEPHVTVRYGLATDNPVDIKALSELPPITAKLGKVSIFETDNYDVVKAEVVSDSIRLANKKVGELVDLPGETFKDYQPHATIAYVKKGEGKKYIGNSSLEGEEVSFSEIELTDRNGKTHKIKLEGKSSPRPGTEPNNAASVEATGGGVSPAKPAESSAGKVEGVKLSQSSAPKIPGSLSELKDKWKDKVDTLFISERGNDITLSSLIVGKANRASGIGTAVMRDLVAYADANGKRILLSPGVKDDKVRFYKRFGFAENKGRNKDFTVSEGMVRNPNAKYSIGEGYGSATLSELTPAQSRTLRRLQRNGKVKVVSAEEAEQVLRDASGQKMSIISGKKVGGFDTTKAGKLIGYKVMRVADNGDIISGANSRLSFKNKEGVIIKMSGDGVFVNNSPQYVIDYYSGLADDEVLLAVEFDEKDIVFGRSQLDDKEPEIGVRSVKIIKTIPVEEFSSNSPNILKSESGKVQGFVLPDSGAAYIIPENIRTGALWPVIRHEIGTHVGRLLQSDKGFKNLIASIESRKDEQSPTGKAIREAEKRIPESTAPENYAEERLAYLIESAPNIGIVRRFIAMVKRALMRMGVNPAILTVDDLAAIADSAVRKEARSSAKDTPNQGTLKASFSGPTSQNATGLDSAKSMQQSGATRDEIWSKTGWFEISPGQWSFEIDDSLSSLTMKNGFLPNALKHPKIYDEYPQLKTVRIKFEDLGDTLRGSYLPNTRMIKINSNFPSEVQRSTAQHEVQHIIQAKEGYATGGRYDVNDTEANSEYWRSTGEVEARLVQERLNMTPAQRKSTPPWVTLEKMLKREGLLEDGQSVEDVIGDGSTNGEMSSVSPPTGKTARYSVKYSISSTAEGIADTYRDLMADESYIKKLPTDSTLMSKIFSSPEYTFKKAAAAWRAIQVQYNRMDEKIRLENEVFGTEVGSDGKKTGFLQTMQEAKKKFKEAYEKANKYLLEVDRTGKTFTLERKNRWQVTTPEGELLGYGEIQTDAYRMAKDRHKLDKKVAYTEFVKSEKAKDNNFKPPKLDDWDFNGRLISDYKVQEGEWWAVVDKDGKQVSLHDNDTDATKDMMDREGDTLRGKGYTEKAVELVREYREMTGRAFNMMIADLRKIIAEAKENGLDEPTVSVVDETKRWAVKDKGKTIATFGTKEDAQRFGGGKHTIKEQQDDEIRKEMKLSEVIAMMSDLRGSYFARQRSRGSVVLRAEKDGEKIMKKFDFHMVGDKYVDSVTGVEYNRAPLDWMKKAFNFTMTAIPGTLSREMRVLKSQGYTITSVGKENSMPESVFEAAKLVSSLSAMLAEAKNKADKKGIDKAVVEQAHKIIMGELSNIIKQRGYMSSRLKRNRDYVSGFEEDMLLSGTQYGRGLSAGIAKKQAARQFIAAVTGTDINFDKWKADHLEEGQSGTYDEWLAFVDKRKLDPVKQPALYGETMGWVKEMLRNEEQVDRVMGTLQGLAVIKFLGFRLSSAAVNATNMVQAVPATISSHTGGTVHGALAEVARASATYGKFRTGKDISESDRNVLLEIVNNGWDEAQFNKESVEVLQSKLGRGWSTFSEWAMKAFGAVEKCNRSITILAAYNQFKKNTSLSHPEAMLKAKHASDRAHGVYGKATRPVWTRGAWNPLRLATVFMKFSQNYAMNMAEMGLKGDHKAVAYMVLSPAILAGTGASIATPVIAALASALGIGGDDPEEEFYKWAEETFGTDRFARHGLAGLVGVNLKGSIQMNNPMPTKISELFGAPGAIFTDSVKGLDSIRKGELYKGAEALLPTALGTMFKAARESTEGITTGSYSPVFYGNEPIKSDGLEATLRFFGFNPARISGIREKQWSEKQVAKKFMDRREEINSLIKKSFLYGKGDKMEVYKEILRYNELVRGSGRADITQINPQKQIRLVVNKARRASKVERMRDV